MNNRQYTLENTGFLVAFILALGVRLLALGRLPLNDSEAELALQALALSKGETVQLMAHPGYLLPTSLLFYLFEASNFLARLLPALAGGLLALAPFLYRQQLGRIPALILAFFLAMDPGLVAISRQADSAALAVAFVFLALGFWLNKRALAAGFFGGLALLSGSQLWLGLVILAVTAFAYPRSQFAGAAASDKGRTFDVRLAGVMALAVILAVGTLFFNIPSGLSAAASSLPDFLRGWVKTGSVHAALPLLALVFYCLPGLLLGVWGALYGLLKSDAVDRALTAGLVVAVLLVLVRPGRAMIDLVWVLPILWALAARQVLRLLPLGDQDILPILGQAGLTLVLVVFAWMNFTAVYMPSLGNNESLVRLAAVAGALMLLALSTLLMGVGWSWMAARTGLIWGLGITLMLFTVSAGVKATGLVGSRSMEMWQTGGGARDANLLEQTVGDLAMWQNGNRQITDVTIVGIQSPALRWVLRDIRDVKQVEYLPTGATASVVITPQQDSLALASSYRGQDFIWDQAVQWAAMKPEDWFVWLLARKTTSNQTDIVLWARTDMFAGGAEQPLQQQNP